MRSSTRIHIGQPSSGPKRSGKPLTVYFSDNLSDALKSASEERRVHKSELVRFAVERLLDELANGQLQLPLGL